MTRTIRVIILQNNKLLLLEKSKFSKNPNKFEFPGGKVEDNESLFEAAIKEVQEETQIVLSKDQFEQVDYELEYSFIHDSNKYERKVYYLKVHLETEPFIKIDETLNAEGESEDKHVSFQWVSFPEYQKLSEQNTIAQNSQIKVSLL